MDRPDSQTSGYISHQHHHRAGSAPNGPTVFCRTRAIQLRSRRKHLPGHRHPTPPRALLATPGPGRAWDASAGAFVDLLPKSYDSLTLYRCSRVLEGAWSEEGAARRRDLSLLAQKSIDIIFHPLEPRPRLPSEQGLPGPSTVPDRQCPLVHCQSAASILSGTNFWPTMDQAALRTAVMRWMQMPVAGREGGLRSVPASLRRVVWYNGWMCNWSGCKRPDTAST
uniref:Uncharacterized protein n=1 Tax=Mycena chlorophos TaxID=658473 RepID=A0ABQ0L8J3_MYCCL|nr:predicted protein [Mycena chlorophos]